VEILLLIPLLSFLIALVFQAPWLTAMTSLPLIIILFLAMVQRAYLAALIGFAWGAYRLGERATDDAIKFGKWFLDFTLGVMLWELVMLLYISHVPIWRQPSRFPLIILYSLLLTTIMLYFGIKSKWFWRLLRLFLILALIWQTVSLFLPETSETILELAPSDRKIVQGIKRTLTPLPKIPSPPPAEKEETEVSVKYWSFELDPYGIKDTPLPFYDEATKTSFEYQFTVKCPTSCDWSKLFITGQPGDEAKWIPLGRSPRSFEGILGNKNLRLKNLTGDTVKFLVYPK